MSISGISNGAPVVAHHNHHRQEAKGQTPDPDSMDETETHPSFDSASVANTNSQAHDAFFALLSILAISGSPQDAPRSATRAAYDQWS